MEIREIGRRIADLREKFEPKMTQAELARKTGIGQSKIKKVESGNESLSKISDLVLIAEALNVSPAYLLTGNTDDNRNCAADELGLKDETITRIRNLNGKQKALLELLVNDEGLVLSEQDLKRNPDLEPECGFLDAMSKYACDPMGNWVVDVKYDPHDIQAGPKIIKMPKSLEIQFSDGTRRKVTDIQPDSKTVANRLRAIRRRYINSLEPMKYIPTEEDDEE